MSECLHCEINQLVQERMESGHADLTEIASMMVESEPRRVFRRLLILRGWSHDKANPTLFA
jgi:hypothetical protein